MKNQANTANHQKKRKPFEPAFLRRDAFHEKEKPLHPSPK
jgi:hypothetical protein